MPLPVWLQVLGLLVVLVTFGGSAVIFLRGSADKGTIDTLTRSNGALLQRVAVLEAAAVVDKAERVELTARVNSLEQENGHLRAERPSAEAIADIATKVTDHDAKLTNHITTADNNGAKVLALLMAIATTLGERDASD